MLVANMDHFPLLSCYMLVDSQTVQLATICVRYLGRLFQSARSNSFPITDASRLGAKEPHTEPPG